LVKAALIGTLVMLVIGIAAGSKFVEVRKDLSAQREGVKTQWLQVDAALERRADLIPNLVETVKETAKREMTVFKDVTDAKAALIGGHSPQEKIQANDQLSGAIGRLLVVTENYPELRSSEDLSRLQDEIAATENRIAIERRKYNEMLEHYNTQIQMFPDNLVAGLSGFRRNDAYFKTEPGARSAPGAQF
jgi:LemA protein